MNPLDFILHLDNNLVTLVSAYGFLIYPILFIVIFCETGLVIAPYLPGDSLLCFAGALAGVGLLNVWVLCSILILAAILGDSVNYFAGHHFGMKILEKHRFVKKEHIERAQLFFDTYGGKTIVIGRFIPFIRTFVPFLAGIGKMRYPHFLLYNIIGGIIWVVFFVLLGYFFGNLPIVKNNFSLVIVIIIGFSLIFAISIIIRRR